MDRVEQGKDICLTIDQLIKEDDDFLNNKTKLYCEYCLSLDKEYVDSITSGLYEECENYLKKFSSNEEKEKQFIKSYESNLAVEGKEICKEVESLLGDNDEFILKKADTYSFFIYDYKNNFDTNLVERCNKFIEDMSIYKRFKVTSKEVNFCRVERGLDMRNIKIK